MSVTVQEREESFARQRAGVVLVLANHRDDLAAASLDLGIGKCRLHHDVGERAEDGVDDPRPGTCRRVTAHAG